MASPSPTPPATAQTETTSSAAAGTSEIDVASTVGFNVGDTITINPGGSNEETNQITGFGSFILDSPLEFDHEAGELVVLVSSSCIDLNGDGKVTGRDVAIVARALKSEPDDKRWNPEADLNDDGAVDLGDLKAILISLHDDSCS